MGAVVGAMVGAAGAAGAADATGPAVGAALPGTRGTCRCRPCASALKFCKMRRRER